MMPSSFPGRSLYALLCTVALVLFGYSGHAAEAGAQAQVRATTDAFFARLREEENLNAEDPSNLLRAAEEIVLPHLNFAAMSQRALGRHWKNLTPGQKGRFARAFRTLLLRTYAKTVNDHRNSTVTFKSERKLSEKVSKVRTEVSPASGSPPFLIDYEMHLESSGWKAYDVTLDGVSLVISYRAGFGEDIARLGIEGVIAQVEEKNRAPL